MEISPRTELRHDYRHLIDNIQSAVKKYNTILHLRHPNTNCNASNGKQHPKRRFVTRKAAFIRYNMSNYI